MLKDLLIWCALRFLPIEIRHNQGIKKNPSAEILEDEVNMNVYDMIREYLEKNGYDGLVSDDSECGCVLADLAPCDEVNNCWAAYKWPGDEESAFYMKTVKNPDRR